MPPETTVWLVRHGYVHNPKKVIYGRLPRFRLSERGVQEARAAARMMSETALHAAYSSPLLRARQTAREILAYHPQLRLRRTPLLNEVFTAFEGQSSQVGENRRDDYYTGVGPPFEQPANIVGRVLAFFENARRRHAGKNVLAVTHGDIILFTTLWARGLAPSPENKADLSALGFNGYPATGSLTAFTFRTDSPHELPDVRYLLPNRS
ncbi:MAG: histidine phosphatase family protein [Desulfobacterales bacterium]|jgi:broad specificity phosphatase PhoE|nr:histidine phosphatase family protein [Desulfobacterales bacterium]